jgi:hypothetical protein
VSFFHLDFIDSILDFLEMVRHGRLFLAEKDSYSIQTYSQVALNGDPFDGNCTLIGP